MGLIFFYVLTDGAHPLGIGDLEIRRNALNKSYSPNLHFISDNFKQYKLLILKMLSYNPTDRLSADQVLKAMLPFQFRELDLD